MKTSLKDFLAALKGGKSGAVAATPLEVTPVHKVHQGQVQHLATATNQVYQAQNQVYCVQQIDQMQLQVNHQVLMTSQVYQVSRQVHQVQHLATATNQVYQGQSQVYYYTSLT